MLNQTAPLPLKDPSLFRQANCIDGKWVQADSGKTFQVINPATGEVVGEVPALGAIETRRAIEAAHRALPAWRALLAKDRATILRKLFDLMVENADDLATIMTAEQGKPWAEARGEISTIDRVREQNRVWRDDLKCCGERVDQRGKEGVCEPRVFDGQDTHCAEL